MATPSRTLPPRAARSAARGVILSTVLQDHPRIPVQNRDGSASQPQAQAAQAANTQAAQAASAQPHQETPKSRRGRPRKTRIKTSFVGNFPDPASDTEFDNSGVSSTARTPRADRDGQRDPRVSDQSLDSTLLGTASGGPALVAAHGPQVQVQNIPNIIQNFAETLISAWNSHSVANSAHARAPTDTQAQTPQRNSGEAQATIPLSRQAGGAENPSGPNLRIIRNLNPNFQNPDFPDSESCAQDYSPRLQRSVPRLPVSVVTTRPEAQARRSTSVPAPTAETRLQRNLGSLERVHPRPENFPDETQLELDSSVSFRENLEQVEDVKVLRFKDGVQVNVPSDINLDSSRVLEFIYKSVSKSAPSERPGTFKCGPSMAQSAPDPDKYPGDCESRERPKNDFFVANLNKNSNSRNFSGIPSSTISHSTWAQAQEGGPVPCHLDE